MIPTMVKSSVPTLIATLVTGTSLTVVTTLVHHIRVGSDNFSKFFLSLKI
ncbi:hypothetical protein XO27_0021 [Bacillus phage phi4I1]|uniref:Uncharacterized protein n=2 Tax=Camtrevirus BtCS33 TaxID=2843759 RepID=A0A2I6UF33_9CAUD|nr:hypothetical protein XO27_0021 [Bacillus phage phi4I1]AUO78583.1 hypothetical protein XO27_0021 [Bacillus phage BtiUFT6.51-F]